MKKVFCFLAVIMFFNSCKEKDILKNYELDKSIIIFPSAKVLENNAIRIQASVSQVEIGSDAVKRIKLDNLRFYIKNLKTNLEKIYTSNNTVIDIQDLEKNSEYLVSIEGFTMAKKSERSKEIFISTSPSPEKKLPTNSVNYQGISVSDNLNMGIIINHPLTQNQPVIINLMDFKTNVSKKIVEFNISNSKAYQFLSWSVDSKKVFFKTIENNKTGIEYYDIETSILINLPFLTAKKISQLEISPDSSKIAYKSENDIIIYDFKEMKETNIPIIMEHFQWLKDSESLAYAHTLTKSGSNQKYYLLSYLNLKTLSSTPLIKREIITSMGGFKISPSFKRVIFGSSLSGGFDAWEYDITNEKLSMIPNESGTGQFKWINDNSVIIIGSKGINTYSFPNL